MNKHNGLVILYTCMYWHLQRIQKVFREWKGAGHANNEQISD